MLRRLLDDEVFSRLILLNGFFNYSRRLLDAHGLLANSVENECFDGYVDGFHLVDVL